MSALSKSGDADCSLEQKASRRARHQRLARHGEAAVSAFGRHEIVLGQIHLRHNTVPSGRQEAPLQRRQGALLAGWRRSGGRPGASP